MEKIQIQQLLVVVLGGIAAWVVFYLYEMISVERSAANRVQKMIEGNPSSIFDRLGQKLTEILGLGLDSWKRNLFWAQTGGFFSSWSVGGIFSRGLIMGVAVFLAILLFGLPYIAWLLIPILFMLPFLNVKGKADQVRKQVKRLLPETATVIAAEMDAGGTAGQAVERASELPGPLGKILSDAVSQVRQSNRAMFSRGTSRGILLEKLEDSRLNELTRFASQLDRVASKGVDAPRIMVDIARGFAREYRSHVQKTAANMDTELLLPMTLFFFLPFMMAILVPLMISFGSMF